VRAAPYGKETAESHSHGIPGTGGGRVAFDAEPAEVQLLQQGQLDALIAQQPVKMGQIAADVHHQGR
jgi:ABC-type sugar transport system substrate-binding protein